MTTRMDNLRQAFDQNQRQWQKYEQDCQDFISEFRQQLAGFLGCETKDIKLLSLSDFKASEDAKRENVHKFSKNMGMWLDANGRWHFTLLFVLRWAEAIPPIRHEEKKQEWVGIHFLVKRKAEGEFSLYLPPKNREVTVSPNDFTNALEYTYKTARDFLESEFRDFLNGYQYNRLSIGYDVPRG